MRCHRNNPPLPSLLHTSSFPSFFVSIIFVQNGRLPVLLSRRQICQHGDHAFTSDIYINFFSVCQSLLHHGPPPLFILDLLWTSGSPEYNYLISNIQFFFVVVADLTLWLWWHFETFHQQLSFFKMKFFWFLIRKIFVSKTLKCSWLWRDELDHQALHPTAWLHTVHTDVPLSLSVLANERPQNVLEKTLNNQKQL